MLIALSWFHLLPGDECGSSDDTGREPRGMPGGRLRIIIFFIYAGTSAEGYGKINGVERMRINRRNKQTWTVSKSAHAELKSGGV